jgi:peptidoglycan/xylan/chitin deacetylase (PgdA/CDA1 family)
MKLPNRRTPEAPPVFGVPAPPGEKDDEVSTLKMKVFLTVDMERDCPPYLTTCRGVIEGTGPLLDLLAQEGVRGTFFTTGEVGSSHPEVVRETVSRGHELGCHGMTHRRFTAMDPQTARHEIREAAGVLRRFAPVTSFRAPNLVFPEAFLPLLAEADFRIDSSQGRYKWPYVLSRGPSPLLRLPVSITSSVLRLPPWLRDPWLGALADPVVLFVHPWEFVDLRREKLRLDCRFRTGPEALAALRSVIRFYKDRGGRFLRVDEFSPAPA